MDLALLALAAQLASTQPGSSICSGALVCRPPIAVPDTAEQVNARKLRHMNIEAQIFAPLAAGRNAGTCASARGRALAAMRSDLASVIGKICQPR